MDDMTARARTKPKGRAKAPLAAPPAAPPRRVAVQISGRLDAALERLAAKTGKPKSLHLRKALEKYIEDTNDVLLAEASRKEPGKRYTSDEIRKLLALED